MSYVTVNTLDEAISALQDIRKQTGDGSIATWVASRDDELWGCEITLKDPYPPEPDYFEVILEDAGGFGTKRAIKKKYKEFHQARGSHENWLKATSKKVSDLPARVLFTQDLNEANQFADELKELGATVNVRKDESEYEDPRTEAQRNQTRMVIIQAT